MKYKGFEVIQNSYNNHVMIVENGVMVAHFNCAKKQTEEGLKKYVDHYLELMEAYKERGADHERTKAD